jgi:hypothetical protein
VLRQEKEKGNSDHSEEEQEVEPTNPIEGAGCSDHWVVVWGGTKTSITRTTNITVTTSVTTSIDISISISNIERLP